MRTQSYYKLGAKFPRKIFGKFENENWSAVQDSNLRIAALQATD
jgi:hypothetical protein